MTPDELSAALEALRPEAEKIKDRMAGMHVALDGALKTRSRKEVKRIREEEMPVLDQDMDAYSRTLSTLGLIAKSMQASLKVDPAIVWAEAIESRVAVATMRRTGLPEGIPSDWTMEMAALIDAKSFYWSPTTISIVKTSAAALPDNTILDAELFPGVAGWWWFGHDNTALTVDVNVGGIVAARRVAALAWLRRDGAEQVWVAAFSADWPDVRGWNGQLHMVWACDLGIGRAIIEIDAHAKSIGDIGLSAAEMFALLRFLTGGLLFIRQRVFVSTRGTIGRGARKRIAPHTHENTIEIVHLRRGETLRGMTATHEHGEFTCQWWVRGHWRQQPYKDGVRPKWIDPFIKGDPDKPMKQPTEKVFAVVR